MSITPPSQTFCEWYQDESITGHALLRPSLLVIDLYRGIFSKLQTTGLGDSVVEIVDRIGLFIITQVVTLIALFTTPVGFVLKTAISIYDYEEPAASSQPYSLAQEKTEISLVNNNKKKAKKVRIVDDDSRSNSSDRKEKEKTTSTLSVPQLNQAPSSPPDKKEIAPNRKEIVHDYEHSLYFSVLRSLPVYEEILAEGQLEVCIQQFRQRTIGQLTEAYHNNEDRTLSGHIEVEALAYMPKLKAQILSELSDLKSQIEEREKNKLICIDLLSKEHDLRSQLDWLKPTDKGLVPGPVVARYLESMKDPKSISHKLELYAISEQHNIEIVVYTKNELGQVSQNPYRIFLPKEAKEKICLTYSESTGRYSPYLPV